MAQNLCDITLQACATMANKWIKITYTLSCLHLENFQDTLKFLTLMSNGTPIRLLPVGIIISILVIVPGPA